MNAWCARCRKYVEMPDDDEARGNVCPTCGGQLGAVAGHPEGGATEETQQVNISYCCKACKKAFQVRDPGELMGLSAEAASRLQCPACHEKQDILPKEIGCPACRGSFWASISLFGSRVVCPLCGAPCDVPTDKQWAELEKKSAKFQWTVLCSETGTAATVATLEDLVDGIVKGRFKPEDACLRHEYAPPVALRKACDEHFALRRLYDPVGAWRDRVGVCAGVGLIVLAVLCVPLAPLLAGDRKAALEALAITGALLGVGAVGIVLHILSALSKTFGCIGWVVLVVVALGVQIGLGLPPVAAVFVLFIGGLVIVGLYWLGAAIGRGLTWTALTLSGCGKRRVIDWTE